MAEYLTVSPDLLKNSVSKLRRARLLVSPSDRDHRRCLELVSAWSRYGWGHASDHHLATFDYPFLDYGFDGFGEDRKRMQSYIAAECDLNRTKRYETAAGRRIVLGPMEALTSLTMPFADYWRGARRTRRIDGERLGRLLSIAFGRLRTVRSVHPFKADLIRKTSPSGGCRHPTEGYAMVQNMDDLEAGIYHFSVADNALERIGDPVTASTLQWLFPGPLRAPFAPKAMIILTSVFERNMYRYREPRTFRTVFMDVGHVIATLQIAAEALGLSAYAHGGVDDRAVERLLGLDGLEEGVIAAVAVGDADTAA